MPQGNVSTNSPQKRPHCLQRKKWKSQKELGQILEFHRVGRPPQIDVDQMVALGRRGMKCSEIAREMSCSKQYVSRWLHRLLADEGPGMRDAGIPTRYIFSGVDRLKIIKLGDEVSINALGEDDQRLLDDEGRDRFLNYGAYDAAFSSNDIRQIAFEATHGGWSDNGKQLKRQNWDATHGGGK